MTELPPRPPVCPYCGLPSRLFGRVTHVRRGDRVLPVSLAHWQCDHGCVEDDGSTPFRFEDPPLLRANDEAVRAAWQAQFGEPLPVAGRPGRKPAEPRRVRVQVLLTPSEVEELDQKRGSTTRSEFIRHRTFRAG
jgi:hypothetical protein